MEYDTEGIGCDKAGFDTGSTGKQGSVGLLAQATKFSASQISITTQRRLPNLGSILRSNDCTRTLGIMAGNLTSLLEGVFNTVFLLRAVAPVLYLPATAEPGHQQGDSKDQGGQRIHCAVMHLACRSWERVHTPGQRRLPGVEQSYPAAKRYCR